MRPRTRLGTARARVAALLLAVATPAMAAAQGSLGVQGFGYPPGQLSTRSLSAGGATGEMDPLAPLNPAALLNLGTTTLYFQAEPEYRRVTIGDRQSSTSISRFPLVTGGLALGSRWAAGVAVSTLADRTWETTIEAVESIGSDTARATSVYRSEGAINDARVGVAYAPREWLHLGLGFHAVSGRNRIFVSRDFVSADFADFADTSTISYGGTALSAGIEARMGRVAAAALSYRKGGRLSAESSRGDSVIGRGDVPDRLGVSVAYLGIARSTIAVRASQEKWSQLRGLGSSAFQARDTWDYSAGGDIAGPRFGPRVIMLRVGGRWRELPFSVVGADGVAGPTVEERSISGGLGTLLAGGRASFDLGVIRASRTADIAVSERSWILSVGLTVRP
ncbi:MAG TPA: hypothetical protein VEA99_12060 [Gemmatimonadaceae bacterium]|nr:hypothetical protein [Gemmatimonadaceae bacterium]